MKPVTTVAGYIELAWNLGPSIYRGQTQSYPLLPGILREGCARALKSNANLERSMLEEFRIQAAPYLSRLDCVDDVARWNHVTLAQHYGLPTRLLDWTTDALAALYFATESAHSTSEDAVVFVVTPRPHVLTTAEIAKRFGSPPWDHDHDSVLFLRPELATARVAAQGSLLSVHPGTPVNRFGSDVYDRLVRRITVPRSAVSDIATQLYRLGVTRTRLFPSAESVCATIAQGLDLELDTLIGLN